MVSSRTLLFFFGAAIRLCSAGDQVTFPIINLSPCKLTVDMTLEEQCIYNSFNPDTIKHYYDVYTNNDLVASYGSDYAGLNQYLQSFKLLFGIPDLSVNVQPIEGTFTIPGKYFIARKAPFAAVGFESRNSGTPCIREDNFKKFSITVNGTTTVFQITNIPSHWTFTKFDADGDAEDPVILGWDNGRFDMTASLTVAMPRHLRFSSIYDRVDSDDRGCSLYNDGDVVGTALVIQRDGSPVVMPLPQISDAGK